MRREIRYLLSCFIVASLCCTGCWDRREINDVAFVTITTLDTGKKKGTYHLQVQVIVPNQMKTGQTEAGGGGKPYMSVAAEGSSLDKLRISIERQLSRQLSTSHRRVLIIGEKLARRGIKHVLDDISRNPENRLRTFLVVAEGMKAKDITNAKYSLERLPVEVFREMVTLKMNAPTTLRDFFISTTTHGLEPVSAGFSLEKGEEGKISLNSMAIFREDKLVGFVKSIEAVLLNSLLGKPPLGIVRVTMPDVKGEVAVQLEKLIPEGKIKLKDDQPIFHFNVRAIGRVTENTTNLDLAIPRNLSQVEKKAEAEIVKLYKTLFHKLQKEYKADSVGLGAMIYRDYPHYWKKIEGRWPRMYPNQKISWHINLHIQEIGVTGPSLLLSEEEVKK